MLQRNKIQPIEFDESYPLSFGINGSPYVRSEEDRKVLLKSSYCMLDVSINELGGRVTPIVNLYNELKRNR